MSERPNWSSWRIGSRDAQSPARRIRPFLLYGVTLLNVFLAVALCAALSRHIVITPSIPFTLPAAEFSSGKSDAVSAVLVMSEEASRPLLFFDGIRYRLDDDTECAALRAALASMMRGLEMSELTLFADGRAPHADVMRFVAEARRAGASAVNIAVREEGGDNDQ